MLKAVLFDWDGTLVDSLPAVLASYHDATSAILGRIYPDGSDELRIILPMRIDESMGRVAESPEMKGALIEAYRAAYRLHSQTKGRAFEGSRAVLEDLHERGLRVGVVTSKGEERFRSDAEGYGLADLVDEAVTAESVAERKPHPEPILFALAQLGVAPDAALYVGDGPQDVVAGHAAGLLVAAAAYGSHPLTELRAERPEWIIDSVSELIAIVSSLNEGHDRRTSKLTGAGE